MASEEAADHILKLLKTLPDGTPITDETPFQHLEHQSNRNVGALKIGGFLDPNDNPSTLMRSEVLAVLTHPEYFHKCTNRVRNPIARQRFLSALTFKPPRYDTIVYDFRVGRGPGTSKDICERLIVHPRKKPGPLVLINTKFRRRGSLCRMLYTMKLHDIGYRLIEYFTLTPRDAAPLVQPGGGAGAPPAAAVPAPLIQQTGEAMEDVGHVVQEGIVEEELYGNALNH